MMISKKPTCFVKILTENDLIFIYDAIIVKDIKLQIAKKYSIPINKVILLLNSKVLHNNHERLVDLHINFKTCLICIFT